MRSIPQVRGPGSGISASRSNRYMSVKIASDTPTDLVYQRDTFGSSYSGNGGPPQRFRAVTGWFSERTCPSSPIRTNDSQRFTVAQT